MKRFFAVFVLTPAEQRLVIFVVLLIVAGAWYKHHRDLRFSAAPRPAETPTPAISPLPDER
ncbi:MAG TPA: hypothetical protein VN921_07495 [Chthoniobacterales bacterium]|nr:hypothetical protein [Chthoniobacterales bacterium]